MADDDPIQWELDQLDKLDNTLAKRYGWTKDSHHYKMRVKLIQQNAISRQKAMLMSLGTKETKEKIQKDLEAVLTKVAKKRDRPAGWAKVGKGKGKKCASWEQAKSDLLPKAPYGPWASDRDAPSGKDFRRYISMSDRGAFERCRLKHNMGAPVDVSHMISCSLACAKHARRSPRLLLPREGSCG